MSIAKEVFAIISDANKVSNELFLNSLLGATPGFLKLVYKTVNDGAATHIQEIMKKNNYTEEQLSDFFTLIKDGYIKFNQECLASVNELHDKYKKNKSLQLARKASGRETLDLKAELQNGTDQIEKAKLAFTHMMAKDTDYSVVLMDHFMIGKLFRPSERFIQIHSLIVQNTRADISLDTFFLGIIHGVKSARDLFTKIETNESIFLTEVMTSYHQDHLNKFKNEYTLDKLEQDNTLALTTLGLVQAHEISVLKMTQEHELIKAQMVSEHQKKLALIKGGESNHPQNKETDNLTTSDSKENIDKNPANQRQQAQLLGKSMRALTQDQGSENNNNEGRNKTPNPR